MGKLEKARKAFVKAFIQLNGHYDNEFQETRNRDASKRVLERNAETVKKAAKNLENVCDAEIEELEKRIDEIKGIKNSLYSISYSPAINIIYMYGIKETFPEIEQGLDAYLNKYFDRKYGVK